jgi:hypothetical protein
VSAGQLYIQLGELWLNNPTPNTFQSSTDVRVHEQFLLGEMRLILNDAKQKYPFKPIPLNDFSAEKAVEMLAVINAWFEEYFGMIV